VPRPSRRHLLLTVLSALVAVLTPAAAEGKSAPLPRSAGSAVWVAPSGSDAEGGTSARPVRTIAKGLALAQPGQRVLVHDGTYPEVTVAAPRGTADAPITLQPAPGAHPVVSNGFKLHGARYTRVTGMTFDGTSRSDGFGTSVWGSEHIELSGNEITGYGSAQGVLVKDGSVDVRIVGNDIHHLGVRHRFEHGIYCENARQVVIADNLIHDIPNGYGIHLFGDCDGTRILRNTIARNGLSGIIIAGNDERGTADDTVIAYNVIAGHSRQAYSEYGFAVTEYQPGQGNVVRDNVFFANAGAEDQDCEACAGRGNVQRDPRFADAEHGDFRLLPSSPVWNLWGGAATARRTTRR
jgi:hypothetical protein